MSEGYYGVECRVCALKIRNEKKQQVQSVCYFEDGFNRTYCRAWHFK